MLYHHNLDVLFILIYIKINYKYYILQIVRKQITITIEEKILREFKKHCEENDINMSKRIERYMKEDLEKSKE